MRCIYTYGDRGEYEDENEYEFEDRCSTDYDDMEYVSMGWGVQGRYYMDEWRMMVACGME